jgi:hypothetical protein
MLVGWLAVNAAVMILYQTGCALCIHHVTGRD